MTYPSRTVLAHAALVLLLGTCLSACQTVGDAASDVGSGVGSAFDSINPFSDSAPSQTAETSSMAPPPAESTAPAPDLASLPSRPEATPYYDNQQVADSLAADRARNQYSSEALRGGTEASAAPPPPGPVVPEPSDYDSASSFAPPAPTPIPEAPATSSAAVPGAMPGAPAQVDAYSAAPQPAAPIASYAAPPPGAQAAVPAVGGQRMAAAPGAAALGFQASRAPALDPTVSQFVPQPILARYRETAADAAVPGVSTAAAPAASRSSSGGPGMSGAVVANLDAIGGGAPTAYYGPGGRPTAVVMFPGDGTSLSAAGRTQVRRAAEVFRANGSSGTIRVVGHASSRTGNMPVETHLRVIFEKSQSRANAVAQALIREGVPASQVLIEAVGDSQPIYYESMPQGEAGNRRAEIFVGG